MQGRGLEVPFQRFHLRGRRFAAVHPGIQDGCERLAQLHRGGKHPPRIFVADGARKFPRLFRSQLYGVTVYDPITLAASTLLIIVTVLIAAALPARRAAGVQPMQALRIE